MTMTPTPTIPGEPVRFVASDGVPTAAGEAHGIDLDLARTLHRDMVLARRLDHEALALQRQGELGLWLMSWGQEAAQAGSVRALRDGDHVFPSYREHVAALVRGLTPAEILAQWRGTVHGAWDPAEHRFHINSLVLGSQTLHATGYAAGIALDGTDEVVAVYFGDGAASQGDVNEAFNWAAAAALPVLFVCQNNQWAISTPTTRQMGTPVHRRAAGFGVHSRLVDGNDALAVHAVTRAAVEHVRSGAGPALVEAVTYRRAGHSTSDDPGRYRESGEDAVWAQRDPIARLRTLLEARGTDAEVFAALAAEADELAVEVRRACRALPEPDLADLFGHAYARPHAQVEADRRTFLTHRAQLAEVGP
ncbi:thiamine pyrophosphate-dependent enzyme [Pseudonocardia pini]|uniref:thiamine pyrophosphate-dependent enzyme n=1 Tax=Pseudonocardia pini TaxID=2758030 RepID=UPI0015EFFAD1|nr:thiamine pyrophosphate-dependent enzyme [Pseudonocardia pini]